MKGLAGSFDFAHNFTIQQIAVGPRIQGKAPLREYSSEKRMDNWQTLLWIVVHSDFMCEKNL